MDPTKKEIKIDEEEAKENYGDMIFEKSITILVEKEYETTRRNLQEAYDSKDSSRLKHITHTLKTNARFLCSENFALECQAIESCTKEGLVNWEKVVELFPQFMEDFDLLFKEAEKIYKINYAKPLPEIEFEADKMEDDLIKKNAANECLTFRSRDGRNDDEIKKKKRESESRDKVYELAIVPQTKTNAAKPHLDFRKLETISNTSSFANNSINTTSPLNPNRPFDIDLSKIRITKSEIDQSFKDKLKNLIDTEINKITADLKKALETENKEEFLKVIRSLKIMAGTYYFAYLPIRFDDWEKLIIKNNLSDLKVSFNDFQQILNVIVETANKCLERETGTNKPTTNPRNMQNTATSFENLNKSNDRMTASPILVGKNNPAHKGTSFAINKDEEQVFSELKAVKFDGLYKKEMSSEEIAAEITRLTQDALNDPAISNKSTINRFNKTPMSNVADNSYPFKQDKLTCILF